MPLRKRKLFNSNVVKSEKQRLGTEAQSNEERERLRESERIRRAIRRHNESEEERERLRESDRTRRAIRRQNESEEEHAQRLQQQRVRQGTLRANNWNSLKHEAFHYNPTLDYINFPQVVIGKMDHKCNFCDALKFEEETPG
jgi:hypothetical protein